MSLPCDFCRSDSLAPVYKPDGSTRGLTAYMENIPAWHGSVKFTPAQAEEALTALGADADEIKDFLHV